MQQQHHNMKQFLIDYILSCETLMYQSPDFIADTVKMLCDEIKVYAWRNSDFYRKSEIMGIVNKSMFKNWHVKGFSPVINLSTQGTTGRNPFTHRYWSDAYYLIEKEFHYGEILREFNIESPKILYMLFQHWYQVNDKEVVSVIKSNNPIHSHGSDNASTHIVNVLPKGDRDFYFRSVFEYAHEKEIDVILTSGQMVNSFVYYAKKLGFNKKLCRLLSTTCTPVSVQDLEFLKENGLVDDWCDHMRCWDGGATFFTCRYGTYHLMDNISYCRSEDQRLISTDYFSLSAPFVNYWNGDYAEIANEYKLCNCGRHYREFKFIRTRPFSCYGVTSDDIESALRETGIKGIFAKCYHRHIEIVCERELNSKERASVQEKMSAFADVLFIDGR